MKLDQEPNNDMAITKEKPKNDLLSITHKKKRDRNFPELETK